LAQLSGSAATVIVNLVNGRNHEPRGGTTMTAATLTTTDHPGARRLELEAIRAEARRLPLHRTAWPWAGVVAGVTGILATLALNAKVPTKAQSDSGIDAVYQTLDNHTVVRIGASLGFVAAYALVVFATGFSRHVARRAPEGSALPQVIKLAMTAGVGTLIVGFGLKAAAAGGMIGGIDQDFYTRTDSVVTSTIAGQMQWVGWQGVAIAMAATVIGVFRYGIAPKWVGAIGALFSAFVLVFTLGLCLPYSAGIVAPPFLVLLSLSLLATRPARTA
jgi:hypothetical protein